MVSLFSKHGWHYLELSKEHAHELVAQGDPAHVGVEFTDFAADHGITFLQGHLPVVWYSDVDRSKGVRGWFDFAPEGDAELSSAYDVTRQWIDLFAAIGIRAAVLHMGGASLKEIGWAHDAVFERRVAALSRIAEYAARAGITICLENMAFPNCDVSTFEEIGAFIAGTPSSNVAVCLDTGHALLAGVDCAEFVLQAQGLLRALHIAENDGTHDEHLLPYTRGTIDWHGVLDALSEIGYGGLFNMEISGRGKVPMPVHLARLEYARALASYLAGQMPRTGASPACARSRG